MKILVVCINYAPEIISTGVYTTVLAEYVAREGVQTDVVTALPYYPAWKTFEGWRRPWWKTRTSENGARITHCPIYVPGNPTGAKRILHYISFALTSLPVLLWKAVTGRPDMVVLIAPSMISAPGVLATAKLAGGKSWLHIQDYEVEAAFATGLLKEDSRTGRMAKRFESWVLRRFDQVSSISDPMLDKLREKRVAKDRVVEFRNWANIEKVTPLEGPSPLEPELGITTPYVALYSGNIANKQGLDVLPGVARHLKHRDDLTIAIRGDGRCAPFAPDCRCCGPCFAVQTDEYAGFRPTCYRNYRRRDRAWTRGRWCRRDCAAGRHKGVGKRTGRSYRCVAEA